MNCIIGMASGREFHVDQSTAEMVDKELDLLTRGEEEMVFITHKNGKAYICSSMIEFIHFPEDYNRDHLFE